MRSLLPLTLSALLLAPTGAWAADGEGTRLNLRDAAGEAAPGHASGGGGGALVRTIIGLVVVIAIIYGIAWVLRQVKASKEHSSAGAGLEPVATLSLGGNRSVHLVRAGEELVLVGVAEQTVTHLRTYQRDEARRLGLWPGEDGPVTPVPATTGSLLDRLRDRTTLR